ncbi:MAG: hypothetical protein ACI9MC_000004 [Kiritimatiellia bacterium]|jgi:hypothetical protein
MGTFVEQAQVEVILARFAQVGWKERDGVKAELIAACTPISNKSSLFEFFEEAKKTMKLDLRWELDEVIEALQPVPEPEEDEEEEEAVEEVEEEPADPNVPLQMSDLNMVYDDPRGLVVYKHRTSERWFAAQPDPATGQPRMFELHPTEVEQLKQQLAGSPYWMLGSGG